MPRFYAALLVVALAYPLGILVFASKQAVAGAAITGTFTVGASLLFALPLGRWFIRKGWLKVWQAVLAGVFVGAVVAMVFALDPLARPPLELFLRLSPIGALHGLAFWLLAIFKNAALVKHHHTPGVSTKSEGAA